MYEAQTRHEPYAYDGYHKTLTLAYHVAIVAALALPLCTFNMMSEQSR